MQTQGVSRPCGQVHGNAEGYKTSNVAPPGIACHRSWLTFCRIEIYVPLQVRMAQEGPQHVGPSQRAQAYNPRT